MAYTNGKIYRLVCNTTGQQYIGSTTQSLSQRLGNHNKDYKLSVQGKITKKLTSFIIISENNYEMILIEEYPCENKNQLERRERHFIEAMECVNKIKPAQTSEERLEHHRQYNKDHRKEINEYTLKNKEKISKYQQEIKGRQSILTNCECGGKYQHKHKARHFKTIKHTSYFE